MVDYLLMENYLKYFKWVAIGGIFIIPFIVLFVSSSLFFPFITGKNFLFRFLVEVIFGCWAVIAIYDKKYRPSKTFILYFVAAFMIGSTLSTIFGVNPHRSFWSNYERMEGLVTFLHLFAYFIATASIFKTEKIWKNLLNLNLGVGLITALYGLVQLSGKAEIHQGGVRLDASLGNAAYLAIYAVFNIFLALLLYFKERESLIKWIYPPIIILQTLILYHTATRGAIIGFIGGLFLVGVIFVILSDQKKMKQMGAGTLAAILLIIAGFWLARNSDFVTNSPVLSRFSSISVSETTTQSRLVIWKMAYDGFKERPILGWGPENFNLVFNKNFQPILWRQEAWFDRAHNVFFDRLTSGGVVGLVTYLGMFGSVVFYLLLKRKEFGFSVYESATLTALLAAYFVHNIFVFDNLISLILFFTMLAYVHSRVENAKNITSAQEVIQKDKKDKGNDLGDNDYQKNALVVAVILITIYSVYFVNAKAYAANKSLLGALREASIWGSAQGKPENLQNALGNFKKTIAYNSFGSVEAREQLISFASQVLGDKKADDKTKQQIYQYAVDQMEQQIALAPDDIRYMIFLGSFYNRAGQTDLAIDILQKAIKLSPKKQQLYFELANSYVNKKDFENGVKTMKIAFELDPSYDDARKVYAATLIFAGREKDAQQVLIDGYGTDIVPDQRLASAYAAQNNIGKVVEIYEKIVEANPTNINNMMRLAGAYSENGQNDLAIKELEAIIAIEPKFKEQGEFYINQIKAGKKP